jgi:hypothetical protein
MGGVGATSFKALCGFRVGARSRSITASPTTKAAQMIIHLMWRRERRIGTITGGHLLWRSRERERAINDM